jgi:hypothetical protein
MKRWLKISLIILACLFAFQMWFRYDIDYVGENRAGISITDRLTGQHYLFGVHNDFSLFPYPHLI